jgi:predicted metal-dependent enzyme (double-stranded beta helix superfamily)
MSIARPATDLTAIAQDLIAAPQRWRHLVAHEPDERTYVLLARDEDVEIYAIGWMHGHDTGFHDHDDSEAVVAVAEGQVAEERLSLAGVVAEVYGPGEAVAVPSAAIHRVRHAGDEPAVSIHVYSPPLRRVGTYEVAENGALLRHASAADTPLRPAQTLS